MTRIVPDLRRINGTPVTVLEYLVGHLLPRPIGSGVLEQNLNALPDAWCIFSEAPFTEPID